MLFSLFFFFYFFFFNDTATTEIYTRPYTLSLHDALPIWCSRIIPTPPYGVRLSGVTGRSEEHTSELQSHGLISYAVFCLKKKKQKTIDVDPILSNYKKKETLTRYSN